MTFVRVMNRKYLMTLRFFIKKGAQVWLNLLHARFKSQK